MLALYSLTGGFTYKSQRQIEAMNAVLCKTPRLMVTMETGGGKTLLFFLPLKMKGAAVTIYVAPLIVLMHDIVHRARQAGIPCIQYSESHIASIQRSGGRIQDGTLVVVMQEMVGYESFQKFSNELIAEHRLDRVVLDEIHMTVCDQGYRPELIAIRSLFQKVTQVLMLSGTMPTYVYNALGKELGFSASDVTFLRYPTVRPNISYNILEFEKGQLTINAVRSYFERYFDECEDLDDTEDRAILYCQKVSDATNLAALLRCHLYIGSEKDQDVRKAILDEWRSGVGKQNPHFIVATKALTVGVDVPHVRLVMHWGIPSSLIDYVQESGRAG
ncbi:P-loop containing nucleoside triphosphate hydrolase protein, partial [Ascobolus immersus RN42]